MSLKPPKKSKNLAIKEGQIPRCQHCGESMKLKVVLYDEMLYDGIAEVSVDDVLGSYSYYKGERFVD